MGIMSSPMDNSTGLDDLDTNELNMSLLANKAKMKEDDEDEFETSIEATPAFEVIDEQNLSNNTNLNNVLDIQEVDDILDENSIQDDEILSENDSETKETTGESPVFTSNPIPTIVNSLGTSSPKTDETKKKTYSPREERKKKHELLYKIKALSKKGIVEPFAVDMSS